MQAAARLHHPNIAVVYDVGEKDVTLYFVMEYLESASLDKLIPETGFKVQCALAYANAIAEALAAVHKANIIHRDVKTPTSDVRATNYWIFFPFYPLHGVNIVVGYFTRQQPHDYEFAIHRSLCREKSWMRSTVSRTFCLSAKFHVDMNSADDKTTTLACGGG